MGISYRPLWILLVNKGLKKTDLVSMVNLSPTTVAKLSKNKSIDGTTLERICAALKCQPGDVIEYISEKSEKLR
jgi:DNA-binding Xre family transcriptional regulator